jgi:hypothetical protein
MKRIATGMGAGHRRPALLLAPRVSFLPSVPRRA